MEYFAGIDVGSSATKAVILDASLAELGRGLCPSGANFEAAAEEAYGQALQEAGIAREQVLRLVSTGYGRSNVAEAMARRTEIDCHARGAYHHVPRAITVIDIGGQDNKVIVLAKDGKLQNFAMNRKCAAGTGSFLEEMAMRLRVPLSDFSSLAAQSQDPEVAIGSYCTVFAMTEILSKIRAGVAVADLARAALASVARRVLETLPVVGETVATGGVVAHNPLLAEILASILKTEVLLPPHPQHMGALGAALFAAKSPKE